MGLLESYVVDRSVNVLKQTIRGILMDAGPHGHSRRPLRESEPWSMGNPSPPTFSPNRQHPFPGRESESFSGEGKTASLRFKLKLDENDARKLIGGWIYLHPERQK